MNGWMIVGNVDALFASHYGQLLLPKIALFISMLVFAGVNRFVLTPRLARPDISEAARGRLLVHSGCGIVLGFAIVALVGLLGTLAPPHHSHGTTTHAAVQTAKPSRF